MHPGPHPYYPRVLPLKALSMRSIFSALTLLPVALTAQAPAPVAAPSLADQFKAQSPAIEALRKTDPDAALAKIEALIPAIPPVFNKTDFRTAQDSMGEYNALTDMYRTAASCADSAGQWEKAKDYALKAKANAQATYDNAVPPFTAFQDTWKKAQAEAQKHLDEEAELAKVEKPTPEQTVQLNGLKLNESVYQKNVSSGKTMVEAVDARLKTLKDQTGDFDAFIANITDRLKTEAGNIDKFKGDKKAFAVAALKGADTYKDKDQEVTYLRRLQVLDPSSKAISHKIDVLLGKAKDEPAKRATSHKKKGH
jgi:hypothetical protein